MSFRQSARPKGIAIGVLLAVGALLVACATTPGAPTIERSSAAQAPDPSARQDVRQSATVQLVATIPPTAPFNGPERWGTDLAFQGEYAFVGNYEGFTVYNIANPEAPTVAARVICPAAQNDVTVYGDLLFLSVDEPRSDDTCESMPGTPGAATGWAGIRIFDISDVKHPRHVKSVRTTCGSHTATLVPGLSEEEVFLYVSSTDECAVPQQSISIVRIPVSEPRSAEVAATPVLGKSGKAGAFAGCHDITAYPEKKLAAAACYNYGLLLDISDPLEPTVLQQVSDRKNFSMWHSATFNNKGSKVVFSDELGGGVEATCTSSTPSNKGADAVYEVRPDHKLVLRALFKIPREQTGRENCVAHNGSLIPVPGKDIMVQGWYQGGVSVWDFTDADRPEELAYFDRGPVGDLGQLGGSWSAYYYNGYIYSSDLTKGLDVLRLDDPRIKGAEKIRLTTLNAQTQHAY